jgi:hypothetical protein
MEEIDDVRCVTVLPGHNRKEGRRLLFALKFMHQRTDHKPRLWS